MLTRKQPSKIAADDIFIVFTLKIDLSNQIRLDVSCESSA